MGAYKSVPSIDGSVQYSGVRAKSLFVSKWNAAGLHEEYADLAFIALLNVVSP